MSAKRTPFRVTYEIVTPESAENGEAEETGYASPHGWRHDDPADLDLREAIDICGRGLEDSGRWFSTTYPDQNYETGADTYYSIHPPDTITPASYARLRRLLTGR